MRQLIVRFLNVAVIAAVLIGYNTVLDKRDKEDQIAWLSAELETTQLQKENLQAAAAASNTADTAASEAAEAEGQYIRRASEGTSKIKGVSAQILETGTLENIDTVSRATCSSKAILEACRNALDAAKVTQ